MKKKKKSAAKGRQGKKKIPFPRPAQKRPKKSARGEECVGRFCGNRRGFGFVTPEGRQGDIFIPAHEVGEAMDGDRVRIRFRREGERLVGTVVAVLLRERERVIGTVCKAETLEGLHTDGYALLPDGGRIPPLPILLKGEAELGDKVEVARPTHGKASILRVFGNAADRAANYEAILAEGSIETEFSPEALAEAERRAAEPLDCESREDLCDRVIFTVDGAGAKDLDDAISLEKTERGWRLGVHIADVSHYVLPYTPLDSTAHARGNSLYFADRVVPMLPEALSNGACSLNAGEDKAAISALIDLSPRGELLGARILRSRIRSCLRGVYHEVNDLWKKGNRSAYAEKYSAVRATLADMKKLAKLLIAEGQGRGVVELETREAVLVLDAAGFPTDIRAAERGDAERMIEAFMLMANRAVAEELTRRGIPCVYRVHAAPPPDKKQALADYLTTLGLTVPWRANEEPTQPMLQSILKEAAERELAEAVSRVLLRSMAKAEYSATASRHFGLAMPLYCHFTSPIRRLSDLVTHRILKAVLLDGGEAGNYRAAARRAALAATDGELRALAAERRIEALYKCQYMSTKLGEVFEATVSSVTPFGYYAELENTCEGLVPLSLLEGDWRYEESSRTLTGKGETFSIGDRVRVRVREVSIANQTLTLEPAE